MTRVGTRDDKERLDTVIGANIQNERLQRNFSREEFAAILDLTTSHLSLIERGERGATIVTLERVVKACDVTIDSLFVDNRKVRSKSKTPQTQKANLYKTIKTLLLTLNENELEFFIHMLKGIPLMRKADK